MNSGSEKLTFNLKNGGKLSRVDWGSFLSSKNRKVQNKVILRFIYDFKSRLTRHSGPHPATATPPERPKPPPKRLARNSSQAQSVYYVKHGQSKKWHSVIRVRPRNLYDLHEQKDEMEQYQLIDLVERGETNQEVELENDNIRIEREDIDGVSVEAPSLNNEEEADLVVVDEPDHENVDDFSDSAIDEDTSEYDEVEDDDWF
uniref:Uncharacterized protein n=1 Tax=Solanum tuberosum TaxID=4113 RepID=M0ZJ14_SOLTU